MQSVALEQLTSPSSFSCPGRSLALVTRVHALPSQVSASVWVLADPLNELPTATQLPVLTHDTPKTPLPLTPSGFGLATRTHLAPFQVAASVRYVLFEFA